MSNLFVLKEQLQAFYAKYSKGVDKVIQLFLAFVVFYLINSKIGFASQLANPLVTTVLSVICALLPGTFTVLAAAVLIMIHMFFLSKGVMLIAFALFLILFVFYFRFTPGRSLIVLLMLVAFFFKIPFVVPVAFALTATPICILPIAFGTMVYYMINYLETSATTVTGADGVAGEMTLFATQILQNKEMWVYIAAAALAFLVVYNVRKSSVDHSWKIAIVAGVIADLIVIVAGSIAFHFVISYAMIIVGNIISAILALILEFFIFSVDYSRAEKFQYEDDEYYYYVKAIPKVSVSVPEKKVKQISRRRPDKEERAEKENLEKETEKFYDNKETGVREKPENKEYIPGMTEEILLARQLQEEVDLEEILKKELSSKTKEDK